MTCIPIKQVYKRINSIYTTISSYLQPSPTIPSYLRPSTPTPLSPESLLPQELIDIIIDELGSHVTSDFERHPVEFQTLQNCALVSRSFRPLATRWVFFRASFQGRWNDETWIHKRVEGFFNILIANPSIGGSVRELFIQTAQNDFNFWLQDNAPLVSILGRLSQIQRFHLVYGLKPINWETLPSKTATALQCTIQSPSLRFLELRDIHGFPWFILAGCRALKDLEIFRVHASCREFIVPARLVPFTIAPMLESVYIIGAYSMAEPLVTHPITAQMFSQLRILSVGFHRSQETEDAANFIIKVAQTLETLNILSLNDRSSMSCTFFSSAQVKALMLDSKWRKPTRLFSAPRAAASEHISMHRRVPPHGNPTIPLVALSAPQITRAIQLYPNHCCPCRI